MKDVELKITILGSGTSTGVPVIACPCEVCHSSSPFNKRTRASILIHHTQTGENMVIDTPPDFRTHMIRHNVQTLDHALYTHTHADHCHGLDDLRAFYFFRKTPVQCWIHQRHAEEFRERFAYVFKETGYLGTKPQISLNEFTQSHIKIGSLDVESVDLPHGNVTTSAYRIGSFAYATDFKFFPENLIRQWKNKVKFFIASGVGFKEHPTHSSVPETVQLFETLGVSKGIITHLSHSVDYERDRDKLAPNVEFAYDGLTFTVKI